MNRKNLQVEVVGGEGGGSTGTVSVLWRRNDTLKEQAGGEDDYDDELASLTVISTGGILPAK